MDARNNAGMTPLHNAAYVGNLEIVQHLLQAGADPALRDYQNYSPLDWAQERGQGAAAEFLVRDQVTHVATQDYL